MGVSAAAACIALVVAGCSGNSPSNSPTASTGPAASTGSGTPSNGPSTGPSGLADSGTGSPYGFATVAQDPTAKITVWVDADRSAIAAAFQKDHPECPLNA